jgi:hypothetical protein
MQPWPWEYPQLCICPERGHGRLSSSSARHRRRVVDAADPPGAVNVASSTAASTSTHASSSSASAHAPDGPVALLASVVIRKLRVDHRLETECTLGRAWCQRYGGLGSVETVEILSDLPMGRRKRGVLGWSRGVSRGVSGYSQRDDEVHDAPEHIREYARTHSRAPVHHRAC